MAEFYERAQPWATTLVLHNWPLMLYASQALVAALLAYRCPTRQALAWLYGWLVLVLGFEYSKHGVEILRTTATYLFSVEVNPGPRAASQMLLGEMLPWLVYAFGLGLLGAALMRRRSARE